MINLRGSRFTDIMPENLASQLETQAFAYATGRQIEKLCSYADGVRIYAAVEDMPEKILDVLAVELRTPAYNQKFHIETKRALVKETLPFYARLGTPTACNQIVEIIFKKGRIEEWFEYDGDPHHFRVGVEGVRFGLKDFLEFRKILESVQRRSSWLDEIIITAPGLSGDMPLRTNLGIRLSETMLPPKERALPQANVVPAARLGWRLSVTTLPMAADTPPGGDKEEVI